MDFEHIKIPDRKIIVAIDFGTTYSGVAWAETHRPDRRSAITSWPISKTIREGESSDKVPTKIRYNRTNNDVEWGFTVPVTAPEHEVEEWFKLNLDPDIKAIGVDLGKEKAEYAPRDVDKLVTDYISALGDHLMYTLRQKLGDGVVSSTPLEFIVTVPAIWSDLAKDKTRKACQLAAGLSATKSPIHLISEPEAAAIYALHGLDPHNLKINDSFVICDAGGGTVDLITYTITKLRPILEVQEATQGTGTLCGSTYLNVRFEMFLREKLGKEEGFDDDVMAEAMERFEKTVKRQFTKASCQADETYTIPVGGLANDRELGISRGRFALKASDLQMIFKPVVEEVIRQIKAQIENSAVPIRAVLLVGGFGASNYLKECIRDEIDRKIQIMQPPNAWLAVVQGAVMKGLAQSAPESLTMVKVQKRKARKHYGTGWWVKYEEKLHSSLRDKMQWCGLDGCYRVPVMEWLIKKGDDVSENTPFDTHFSQTTPVREGRIRKVGINIYCDRSPRTRPPIARDDNVAQLCRLEADLSHIPESELPRRTGHDGHLYYFVNGKVEAVYSSASTQYTLVYNGVRYNSVTAEYV